MADTWIRSSWRFGPRVKILTLSLREGSVLLHRGYLVEEMSDILKTNDPDSIERGFMGVIEKVRPDLKGGILEHITSTPMVLEFAYSHPSFPHDVKLGFQIKSEPLITDEIEKILAGQNPHWKLSPQKFQNTWDDYGKNQEMLSKGIIAGNGFISGEWLTNSPATLKRDDKLVPVEPPKEELKSEGDALLDFFKGK